MGIKMSSASDQNKQEWEADTYQKGMGAEPLQCTHCATPVAHNPPHTREMHDKSVFVQGYFRLLPKGAHSANCPFGVDEEITKIAKTSEGLIESLQKDRYQMRLVMIKEALEGAGTPKKTDGGTRATAGRKYTHNPGLLPAYINSANRALKCKRSTNHTYHQMRLPFILAFPVSSSTAATPHSRPPTAQVATSPVRGAATYRAPGR